MADIYNEQITTQAPGQMTGGAAPTDALHAVDRNAQAFEKQGKEIYSNSIRAQSAQDMAKIFAENDGKPLAELETALDKYRSSMAETIIDPEVAVGFLADYDMKKAGLMGRAIQNNILLNRKENKTAAFDNFQTSVQGMSDSARAVFLSAGDDDDIFVGFQNDRANAFGAIGTQQDNGVNAFTDSERKNMKGQISTANFYQMRDVLGSEDTDPIARERLISKINNNDPAIKSMFDPKDWIKVQSLTKSVAGKSAKESMQTMTAMMFQEELDGFKKETKDTSFGKADMGQMIKFRTGLSNEYEKGNLSEKEYKKMMSDTAVATLGKINDYAKSWDWAPGVDPVRAGYRKINSEISKMDLTPAQQLYIYESFAREYVDAGGTNKNNKNNDNISAIVAENVITSFLKLKNPNWTSSQSNAIVLGNGIYRTPGTKTTRLPNVKQIEIDVEE